MITVYTKPHCSYCDRAKNYLAKNGFEHEVIDITENPEAYAFMKSNGHKTVPQIYHDGKLLMEGGATALLSMEPRVLKERIGDIDVSKIKL